MGKVPLETKEARDRARIYFGNGSSACPQPAGAIMTPWRTSWLFGLEMGGG